jgi:hypothetical protein
LFLIMSVCIYFITVIFIKAYFGVNPYITLAISENTLYTVWRQTVFRCKMIESYLGIKANVNKNKEGEAK